MIVYIRSNESNHLFPENKPWHFKIHLKSPLVLKENGSVSLLEFQATASKSRNLYSTNQTLFVFSNICSESIIDGEKKPLLRRVSMIKMRKWESIFNSPIYLSTNVNELFEFEIYIKDLQGHDASFLQDPVQLTLHIKH